MDPSAPSKFPLEYLLTCSDRILGEYQLSRLDKASHLKRQARLLREQAIMLEAEAAFALMLREHRRRIAVPVDGAVEKRLADAAD